MLKLKFERPKKFEIYLFTVAVIIFAVLDYAQNVFQFPAVDGIYTPTMFGIDAITLFWITFVLYHISIFIAFIRAVAVRGTHHYIDWVFGSLIFVGMYFILAGAVGAIYYAGDQAVPWLFNLPQITAYHFLGILIQVISLGYFMVTE